MLGSMRASTEQQRKWPASYESRPNSRADPSEGHAVILTTDEERDVSVTFRARAVG
jgi:hypothetical protein